MAQCLTSDAVVVWSAVASWILVRITAALTGGLRVDPEVAFEGLDISTHGERGYTL